MEIAVFSTRAFDRLFLDGANAAAGGPHTLTFFEAALNERTAGLARGFAAVCPFVNDVASAPVLEALFAGGTRLVALRSAGFNHVDLEAADRLGMVVGRVPAYSPHAVAEHTVGLMLTLNRKFHRAFNRVREHNFALDGLVGFDMHGKTVGIVGTGQIGCVVAGIVRGFGCRVLAADPARNPECERLGARYAELGELFAESDIITLHCPLTPRTRHLVDAAAVARMKPGVMLINTSRGAVIDTRAVIEGLKGGRIGYLGLDVYEEEGDLFFRDLSQEVIQDDVFARLLTFPNVVITGHQAFLTREALGKIGETTIANASEFARTGSVPAANRVTAAKIV